VIGGWRKLHNEQLHELNCSRYIIRVTKIKEIEMGGACITHGRDETYLKNLGQNPEGKDHFEAIGIVLRIILQSISKKLCGSGELDLSSSGCEPQRD
jgi:hypothetical protein